MRKRFLLKIKAENLLCLGELRLYPSIEIGEFENNYWVKGIYETSLKLTIASIPAEHRFWISEQDTLIPFGKKVPIMKLPITRWQTLKEFMKIELPPCTDPPDFDQSIQLKLKLKPSDCIQKANGLLCSLDNLSNFVENTSAIRLEPLTYAIKSDMVFVIGTPLPSLSGLRYRVANKIAVPLGYSFPFLNSSAIKRIIKLETYEHALFYADNSWERVPDDRIAPLTRSSFRLTKEFRDVL